MLVQVLLKPWPVRLRYPDNPGITNIRIECSGWDQDINVSTTHTGTPHLKHNIHVLTVNVSRNSVNMLRSDKD